MTDLTEIQQAILHTKREHPEKSPSEIADRVGCSESYARDVLSDYDTAHLSNVDGEPATAEDVEPPKSQDGSGSNSGGMGILLLLLLMLGFGYAQSQGLI